MELINWVINLNFKYTKIFEKAKEIGIGMPSLAPVHINSSEYFPILWHI